MAVDVGLSTQAVAELRGEFPALLKTEEPVVFMDGPGGTQVHGSVIAAMGSYLVHDNSNAGGAFGRSRRTDETAAAAREAMADFLHASRPEEIVFGPNMTSLTFAISRSIGRRLVAGDEIVVTRLDHDANISPWLALEEKGIVVRHADFLPEDCTLDWASLEAALTKRTRVVALGYASNAVGTVNDVRRAAELAHAVGAWLYVDAVHYAPHGLIDVQALDCEFLACSTYKFFGPHLGALYGRYELLQALPAFKVRPAHDEPPFKFEMGTPCFEALAGATATVDYLASVGRRFGGDPGEAHAAVAGPVSSLPVARISRRRELQVGMAAIQAYERRLCTRLVAGLRAIPGLRVYGIVDEARLGQRVPTVSFTLNGLAPREIAARLGEAGILVWDGNFYAPAVTERLGVEGYGGLVRVGLCHYNTADEVQALLDALAGMRC